MTLTEFDENINTWNELIEVCVNNGFENCDSIVSYEEMSERINEAIGTTSLNWFEIREQLNEIDTSFDWYRMEGGEFSYTPLDDVDFEMYKDSVRSDMLTCAFFTPEPKDEDEEDDHDFVDDEEDDTEEVTTDDILGMMASSRSSYQQTRAANDENAADSDTITPNNEEENEDDEDIPTDPDELLAFILTL